MFSEAGIEVLAPKLSEIVSLDNGFAVLASDKEKDPRMIELLYLQNLTKLGENGFSYFVNPDGYIGCSASYELGIAQVSSVRHFFLARPTDHPVYVVSNSVWQPEDLMEYITTHQKLPEPTIPRNELALQKLWEKLMVPESVVAVGAIIEHESRKQLNNKEILLVKTHKWNGLYSVVGEKVRRNERLDAALVRGVKEETGLSATIGDHICTFDQIRNSGYYLSGVNHIFVDKIVSVSSKMVRLNEEAEEYIWLPAAVALKELPIEPNARHTLELYHHLTSSTAYQQ